MSKNEDILEPIAEPISDEKLKQIENGTYNNQAGDGVKVRSHLVVVLVFSLITVAFCLFGVSMVIMRIHAMGAEVEDKISSRSNWIFGDDDVIDDGNENDDVSMLVGDDEYGYMATTSNWTRESAASGIEYSSGLYSLRMDYVSSEDAMPSEAMLKFYNSINQAEVESLYKGMIYLGNYSAFRVYFYDPADNLWKSSWFFDTGDGKTRILSIEGPSISDSRFSMPLSYSLNKNMAKKLE